MRTREEIEEEARECRRIAQRWEPRHDNYALHMTRARALEWVLATDTVEQLRERRAKEFDIVKWDKLNDQIQKLENDQNP